MKLNWLSRLERWSPPGLSTLGELKCIASGLVCSAVYSLTFLYTWANERRGLYNFKSGTPVLRADAVMPDFADLLHTCLYGFFLVALCMAALGLWHYAYHRQGGSNSAYLMRRLPDRWEFHRRCLALPVLALLASLLLAFLFLCLYYWVYRTFTPNVCLTPDQWQKIWSVRK